MKSTCSVIFGVVLTLVYSTAQAAVKYTYTNQNTFVSTGCPSTGCKISGYFEMEDVLQPSSVYTAINPLSFLFTDGRQAIDSYNLPPGLPNQYFWSIVTNSNGDIVSWNITVSSSSSGNSISSQNEPEIPGYLYIGNYVDTSKFANQSVPSSNMQARWTTLVQPVAPLAPVPPIERHLVVQHPPGL